MVRERAPKAIICLDAFHVVSWAMKALDKVRVRTMTTAGVTDRHAMWATRKNPPDLTTEQRTSLASIAATNKTLYRAYLLKEQLREPLESKARRVGSCWPGGCRGRRTRASPSSSTWPAVSAATAT